MNLKNIAIILILMTTPTWADEYQPMTRKCLHEAASTFDLPVAALYGIFAQERGAVGQYSANTNNSRDNGTMQINSIWLPDLARFNITEEKLRNNGCLTVYVSAWILKGHLEKANGNIWKAIGDYHSKTPEKAKIYISNVMEQLLTNPNYDKLIAEANKHVRSGQ